MKMRLGLVVCMAALPVTALAEFVPLSGKEITAVLTDASVSYQMAAQQFFASGQTLFETDSPAEWGSWRVEGDKYCSQWPPSDGWTCYAVAREAEVLRFIASDGSITDGVLE